MASATSTSDPPSVAMSSAMSKMGAEKGTATATGVPKSQRPHLVLVGRVNSGKSTLFNKLLGQDLAVTSPLEGTTTDPISRAIEVPGIGPLVLVDTPGWADETSLGAERMKRSQRVLRSADLILWVQSEEEQTQEPPSWLLPYKEKTLALLNQKDFIKPTEQVNHSTLCINALTGEGVERLWQWVGERLKASGSLEDERELTEGIAKAGDLVLLVMPQDAAAPKGRLILPQARTLRELLDKHCIPIAVQLEELPMALQKLTQEPDLVITDSKVFREVDALLGKRVPLTSFSVLMSGVKGDLPQLLEGAKAMERLTTESRILIAEACSHAPASEDIGTVRIPALLRKRYGEGIQIEHAVGQNFPDDLSRYQLIIHCGSCMLNRAQLLSRQAEAQAVGVPMTNYGLALAFLTETLPRLLSHTPTTGVSGVE